MAWQYFYWSETFTNRAGESLRVCLDKYGVRVDSMEGDRSDSCDPLPHKLQVTPRLLATRLDHLRRAHKGQVL